MGGRRDKEARGDEKGVRAEASRYRGEKTGCRGSGRD